MPLLGITDTLRLSFDYYTRWIQRVAPEWEIVKLSPLQDNAGSIERCHALLLTGGGDIHPRYYGREDAIGVMEGINEERDRFEFGVIAEAAKREIPVLGICRGMQVFNVFSGGTMIPDVQLAGYLDHGKGKGTEDRVHDVGIEEGSILAEVVPACRGTINTNHHQAVDKLGRGLKITARSEDGVVEALEGEGNAPFLLLVQWHPERMMDFENPLSKGILRKFINAVELFTQSQYIAK